MLVIGKYTIKKDDELNFSLFVSKKKGSFRGKQGVGNKEHLIGYFGYLDMAMSKIINLEALEAVSGSDDSLTAEDIRSLFSTVETQLKDAYHHRSKDYEYKGDR